jgi:hypothetical protein
MENAANLLQFMVVCGTQSRLRIRGKNLCAHGENAKRHKTGDILVNNVVRHEKYFRSLLSTHNGLDYAKKPFHAAVPLTQSVRREINKNTKISSCSR